MLMTKERVELYININRAKKYIKHMENGREDNFYNGIIFDYFFWQIIFNNKLF